MHRRCYHRFNYYIGQELRKKNSLTGGSRNSIGACAGQHSRQRRHWLGRCRARTRRRSTGRFRPGSDCTASLPRSCPCPPRRCSGRIWRRRSSVLPACSGQRFCDAKVGQWEARAESCVSASR